MCKTNILFYFVYRRGVKSGMERAVSTPVTPTATEEQASIIPMVHATEMQKVHRVDSNVSQDEVEEQAEGGANTTQTAIVDMEDEQLYVQNGGASTPGMTKDQDADVHSSDENQDMDELYSKNNASKAVTPQD